MDDAAIIRRIWRLSQSFYGRRIFFLNEASKGRWFIYQQRLLAGRLLRSLKAAFLPLPETDNPFFAETPNHQLTWHRAVQRGYPLGKMITPAQMSRRMAWTLLFWNLTTMVAHPVAFLANLKHPRLRRVHERLFYAPRMRSILTALRLKMPREIGVSNDHVGQGFQIATAAALLGVPVTYVQHGAVTPLFPANHYSKLIVWDQATADIYATKTEGRIIVDPELKSAIGSDIATPDHFTLVAISIVYPLKELLLSLRSAVRLRRPEPVLIRFHPSDKRAGLVMAACRLFRINVERDTPLRPFSHSFRTSTVALIATSSVLSEAIELDPTKVIWVRHLGATRDYYQLGEKIRRIANSRKELEELLARDSGTTPATGNP